MLLPGNSGIELNALGGVFCWPPTPATPGTLTRPGARVYAAQRQAGACLTAGLTRSFPIRCGRRAPDMTALRLQLLISGTSWHVSVSSRSAYVLAGWDGFPFQNGKRRRQHASLLFKKPECEKAPSPGNRGLRSTVKAKRATSFEEGTLMSTGCFAHFLGLI